jgi:hypothetical protein
VHSDPDQVPLENRLRKALAFPVVDAGENLTYVDPYQSIRALGSVLAEILAHFSEEEAREVMEAILSCRREWMATPRVLEQLKPQGVA